MRELEPSRPWPSYICRPLPVGSILGNDVERFLDWNCVGGCRKLEDEDPDVPNWLEARLGREPRGVRGVYGSESSGVFLKNITEQLSKGDSKRWR